MASLATLKETDISSLTEAWNRCWQGYFYEMKFTEENLKVWINRGQVQLGHSMALMDNGLIIGFSLLGLEGVEGWIAGTAIDPLYRGHKLFAPMLQTQLSLAKHLQLNRVYLEVLSQNYALHTYKAVGFRPIRELQIYRIAPQSFHSEWVQTSWYPFYEVPLANYLKARQQSSFVPAWQRRDAYLQRYYPVNAWLNSEKNAGILFAGEKGTTLLDAWSTSQQSVPELFLSISHHTHGEFSLTNQPTDSLTQFLNQAKIFPSALQYEMVCDLL